MSNLFNYLYESNGGKSIDMEDLLCGEKYGFTFGHKMVTFLHNSVFDSNFGNTCNILHANKRSLDMNVVDIELIFSNGKYYNYSKKLITKEYCEEIDKNKLIRIYLDERVRYKNKSNVDIIYVYDGNNKIKSMKLSINTAYKLCEMYRYDGHGWTNLKCYDGNKDIMVKS